MFLIVLLILSYFLFNSFWSVGFALVFYLLTMFWQTIKNTKPAQDPEKAIIEKRRSVSWLIILTILILLGLYWGFKLYGIFFVVLGLITFIWSYFQEIRHAAIEQQRIIDFNNHK